jgi:hypothetical protein
LRESTAARLQVVPVELQQAESGHHADGRWHVQNCVTHDGHRDREHEQSHDDPRTLAQFGLFVDGVGLTTGYEQAHDACSDDPVDQRWHDQCKEFFELDVSFLPHHERGDVAERTECTTRVGRDNNVDTAEHDERAVGTTDCHDDRCHQQGGREVVSQRGHDERNRAGYPEQFAKRETLLQQP